MSRKTAVPPLPLTPAGAIAEGGLLGSSFIGSSWNRWRAVLRAAYAEPLSDADRALFAEVAEREPPAHRVKELWVIGGRRSGKDSIASAIAAVAALGDYTALLRPGERASVLCLAVDRTQAKIVFRYIKGYFSTVPLLTPLVVRETEDTLELANNVEIVVSTNSFRAVRGRTIVCAIFDEVAYWLDESSATPDVETYNAVLPATATMPDAMLIGISSPHRRSGLLFERWTTAYGKPGDDVLVVRGASKMFNPTIPDKLVADAIERDPDAAGAEWLGEWRSDTGEFLSRDLIAAAVDDGVLVRPPRPDVDYISFCDPSSGRGDSFAAAIAHTETDGAVVLDALYERRPPFDPAEVVPEVAALLRDYGIGTLIGDRHAPGWVASAFAARGTGYEVSPRDRSALYADVAPLFAAGRVRLLDNRRMAHQFATLQRTSTGTGRDRINHAPGGADDVANAAAGALTLAAAAAAPSLVHAAKLLRDAGPVPLPSFGAVVFSTMIVGQDGQVAICYFSHHDTPGVIDPAPLVLVDFSLEPLTGTTIDTLAARLETLHRKIPRVRARIAWVPGSMMSAVRLAGYSADEYPPDLLTDLPALAVSVAAVVNAGRFRIAHGAAEKAKLLPLAGALTFRAGEPLDRNPLRLAVLAGIGLVLPLDAPGGQSGLSDDG